MPSRITEKALLLGPRKSMVGVTTKGAPSSSGLTHPTVVILNSGILHRVGANRMSVMLARALAAAGCDVLRFDLSGIGDSEPRTDTLAPLDASLADIKEALDSLEAAGRTGGFILVGLCSGADQSLIYAGSDPRVVGAVLLDPSVPLTFRHYVHHYARRLTRLESWINLARGRTPLFRLIKERVAPAPHAAERQEARSLEDPEVRAYLEQAYRRLLDNGVGLLVVLTGEHGYYRTHLLDAFPGVPFGDRLRLEYFGNADHVFTDPVERERVMTLIVNWAAREKAPAGHSPVLGQPARMPSP